MSNSEYTNNTFQVLMSTKNANLALGSPFSIFAQAQLCPPAGCYIPPPPDIGTPMLWSKKSTWPNKKVPTLAQRVVIDSNMWVVLDVSPPKLGLLVVNGKLSFITGKAANITLQVQSMQVYGMVDIVGDDGGAYDGTVNIILYGGIGASLPLNMGEGIFAGSKAIAVVGSFVAIGRPLVTTRVSLNSTAVAGSSTITVNLSPGDNSTAPWSVGDEIVLSPTGYFKADGAVWSSRTGSAEIRKIVSISSNNDSSVATILLNSTLTTTHLCIQKYGERFCGYVGHLTRSITISSVDCEDPKSSSYGFGGHILVTQLLKSSNSVSRNAYGFLQFQDVALIRMGKSNSDHFSIAFSFVPSSIQLKSLVTNCAFVNGYNVAIQAMGATNLTIEDNVIVSNWGGGIFIDSECSNVNVLRNLITGTNQLSSVLKSTYPWNRPIAAVSFYSPSGLLQGNVAAGSADSGFIVGQSLFTRRSDELACANTNGAAYSTNMTHMLSMASFWDNEAVGAVAGLTLVTQSPSEVSPMDCIVIAGFQGWRNAHAGILSVDTVGNVVITHAVLAENHMGTSLGFVKSSSNAFSGIVNSKVIGSLSMGMNGCTDLSDSSWSRMCQVFTTRDPLGVSQSCGSTLLGTQYKRVGVLLPQFMNKGRTCALAGRFATCEPPNTLDRLCALPYDNRYAVPVSMQYPEQHIHNVTFLGFSSGSCRSGSTSGLSGAAVALNPDQIDQQPSVVASGLSWEWEGVAMVNMSAKFGFDTPATACSLTHPCTGLDLLIVHDLDGSVVNGGVGDGQGGGTALESGNSSYYGRGNFHSVGGQLLFNNPEYVAPSPQCDSISQLGMNFYYCPIAASPAPFRQYHALWRDSGPQVLQPIVTTRYFNGENRSFATFGPTFEPCSHMGFYSRYPMLLAAGVKNRVMATGTVPSSWYLRWDAPSSTDSTVVEFFISNSNVINVFVGKAENDPNFVFVDSFRNREPTLDDPAGSNARNPQSRTLTVTLRGGRNNFYLFNVVPTVAVTMKMQMSISNFFADSFVANLALLLSISPSRIAIAKVTSGSVIVDFQISPANSVVANSTGVVSQVTELKAVTQNFSQAINSGSVAAVLGVSIDQIVAVEPVIPVQVDETYQPPANVTVNATAVRLALLAANTPKQSFLFTYPTSLPSNQPSTIPSGQPSALPTRSPSSQPSVVPSSEPTQPTGIPSSQPSLQPSMQPTCHPTSQPTVQPSSRPSRQPSRHPTSQPACRPSAQPSRQPVSFPSSQPSLQPVSRPTRRPTRQPTSQPSRQPLSRPSSQPSRQPTTRPSLSPSRQPSLQPTRQPTSKPSKMPSSQPTRQPSLQPFRRPTGQPSHQPNRAPSALPSTQPSYQPSLQPIGKPSRQPSTQPSSQPTRVPSNHPTSQPSSQPTSQPSARPSSKPSTQPSSRPSQVPSNHPTSQPSVQPSSHPSVTPTSQPSIQPSSQPSEVPSTHPSSRPSQCPSAQPAASPSRQPTAFPSVSPSSHPSRQPSSQPRMQPTSQPSSQPAAQPTSKPSRHPSSKPSRSPSTHPSSQPSHEPTSQPSEQPLTQPSSRPSNTPSTLPSSHPSSSPSALPSCQPSREPSAQPSSKPSVSPSSRPSSQPFARPTSRPSKRPSAQPTRRPITHPSSHPSAQPYSRPSTWPSFHPSSQPSSVPSTTPSILPSRQPTKQPYSRPSGQPTDLPVSRPSAQPSRQPLARPTNRPSKRPSSKPSTEPFASPSTVPSSQPVADPTSRPTRKVAPTGQPTAQPNGRPTRRPSNRPSTQPSLTPSSQPSLKPSSRPSKTARPSYSSTASAPVTSFLVCPVATVLGGISVDQFFSAGAQQSFKETVVESVQGVSVDNVKIVSVASFATVFAEMNSHFEATSPEFQARFNRVSSNPYEHIQGGSSGVQVNWELSVPLVASTSDTVSAAGNQSSSADLLFSKIKSQLDVSVQSNTFAMTLARMSPAFANTTVAMTVSPYVVLNPGGSPPTTSPVASSPSPTEAPSIAPIAATAAPSVQPSSSTPPAAAWTRSATIACVTVAAALLATIFCFAIGRMRAQKKSMQKVVAGVDGDGDGDSNFSVNDGDRNYAPIDMSPLRMLSPAQRLVRERSRLYTLSVDADTPNARKTPDKHQQQTRNGSDIEHEEAEDHNGESEENVQSSPLQLALDVASPSSSASLRNRGKPNATAKPRSGMSFFSDMAWSDSSKKSTKSNSNSRNVNPNSDSLFVDLSDPISDTEAERLRSEPLDKLFKDMEQTRNDG